MSFSEQDTIKGWIYTPIRKPKGIIQLVHGFGEHSRRYLHMILRLNEEGFIAACDDHIGHGKTAYDAGNWENWGEKGYMTMAEDEHQLRKIVQEKFADLPFFLFGHSMGSMIVRNYVTKYGEGVYAVSNWLAETGHTVKTKLYSGYRHEIHNYRSIREEVEDGIVAFIKEVLQG